MTPSRPDPKTDRLRRLLAAQKTEQSPAAAERLARALTGEPGGGLTCDAVQAELPAYVDEELRGLPVAARHPAIAQHLLACESCGAIYALLLDRELAPALAPLEDPISVAELRRETGFEEVRRFVTRIAEATLQAIRPAALPGLAAAAQVFFDEVRELQSGFRLEPAAAYAMGQGGELTPALRFVMASFLATQRITQEPSAAQARPPVRGELSRKIAFAAAVESGLSRGDARRFADAYADALSAASELPEWPARE